MYNGCILASWNSRKAAAVPLANRPTRGHYLITFGQTDKPSERNPLLDLNIILPGLYA